MRKKLLKHRVLGRWAIFAVLILAGNTLRGQTYGTNHWLGASQFNSSWFNTENWSPHSVPGTNDTILLNDSTNIWVKSVTVPDGTYRELISVGIAVGGTFGVGSTMSITNGSLGGGVVTVLPGASLLIQDPPEVAEFSSAYSLANGGTVTWTGNRQITVRGPLYFTNLAGATFDVQGDWTFYDPAFGGYPGFIVNAGTFQKSSGSGTTDLSSTRLFSNVGTVEAKAGVVSFEQYDQTSGTTRLDGGALWSYYRFSVLGGSITGSGTLTSVASALTNQGEINLGPPFGRLQVEGDFVHRGTFNAKLGGTNAGSAFDQITVTGHADLGGTLNLTLTNGYRPRVGDKVAVLMCGSRSGGFAVLNGFDAGGGLVWLPDYTTNGLVLTAAARGTMAIAASGAGRVQVRMDLPTSGPYGIEASTNLEHWDRILTTNRPDGFLLYEDADAVNFARRFYRTVIGP